MEILPDKTQLTSEWRSPPTKIRRASEDYGFSLLPSLCQSGAWVSELKLYGGGLVLIVKKDGTTMQLWITSVNDFRNTYVAHTNKELTEKDEAIETLTLLRLKQPC